MSVHFDREKYFDSVRHSLFGGSMTEQQVIGQEAILLAWEVNPLSDDLRHLAYSLSTTMHETANSFMPIEEYQGSKQSYGQVDPQTGQAYWGRGYVQLTHRENYVKATAELELVNGDDLEWHADRALDPQIAADVMFYGMTEGWFRPPNRLELYFSDVADDAYGAREIINGDKHIVPSWSGGVSIGKLIAGYHDHFLEALTVSSQLKPTLADVFKLELTVPEGVNVTIVVNGVPLIHTGGGMTMIGTIISIILMLVVLGVVLWGLQQLLPLVPMDPRLATVVRVLITVLVVLVVVWVIAGLLGVVSPVRL